MTCFFNSETGIVSPICTEAIGNMVSLQGNKIVAVPPAEAVAEIKTVDPELYDIAKVFFG